MTLAQGQQDKSQTAASLELEKENSRMCNIYTKAIFLMQELSKSVRTMPAISRARAREREREMEYPEIGFGNITLKRVIQNNVFQSKCRRRRQCPEIKQI